MTRIKNLLGLFIAVFLAANYISNNYLSKPSQRLSEEETINPGSTPEAITASPKLVPATRDPDLQLPAAATPSNHWNARGSELIAIGLKSIPEALAFIRTHYPPDPEGQQVAIRFLLQETSSHDLAVVSQLVPLLTDWRERGGALSSIANHWINGSPSDYHQFLQFTKTLTNGAVRNELLGQAVSTLTRANRIQDAKQLIESMPSSLARDSAINHIASAEAETDPADTLKWINSLPRAEEAASSRQAMFAKLTAKNDASGLALLSASASPALKSGIAQRIGRITASQGLAALRNLKASGLSQKDYELTLTGALELLPATDLDGAIKEAISFTDPDLRARAIGWYVGRVFTKDPAAAVQWVQNSPPAAAADAVCGLINSWYQTNSTAASEWVNALPNGIARDAGLQAEAQLLIRTDRNAARKIAVIISDPQIRSNMLQMLK